MRTIIFSEVFTSGDGDVLNGTELETAPGNGLMTVRAASTVNTATLNVQSPNQPAVSVTRAITLRANGEVRSYDVAWTVAVRKDERVEIALAGTTGTVFIFVTYMGS